MLKPGIFAVLTITAAAAFASGESLRCGSKIVDIGMSMAQVEKFCGKPSSTRTEQHDVHAGNRVVGTTQLHNWTYDRASGQNAAVLEFDQEKLLSITFVRK
jgi:hypothetical protein